MDAKATTGKNKPAKKTPAKKAPVKKAVAKGKGTKAPAKKPASTDSKKPRRSGKPIGAAPEVTAGRFLNTPEVWTDEYTLEIAEKLVAYVAKTKSPSVAEFCYLNHVHRQRLYDNVTLATIRDWLISKKIASLETAGMGLTKEQGSRGAFIIFALKQLGWKDKTEVEHTGTLITIGEPPRPATAAAVSTAAITIGSPDEQTSDETEGGADA